MSVVDVSLRKRWLNDDLPVDLQEQWLSHINEYELAFPRDVAFLGDSRFPVVDKREYVDRIWENMSGVNSYTDVTSKPMQAGEIYDTFYLDIDADLEPDADDPMRVRMGEFQTAIREAETELRKIVEYTQSEYDGWVPRVYFSGGRGFAVYFDMPATNVHFDAIESVIYDILDEADVNFDIVDTSVFEKNRLCRLPYTLNWNNPKKRNIPPLMCIPIDPTWSAERIVGEAMEPSEFLEVKRNPNKDLAREVAIREEEIEVDYNDSGRNFDSEPDPAEALDKIDRLFNVAPHIKDGRSRIIHFVLVPALIEAGYPENKIYKTVQDFIETCPGARWNDDYRDKTAWAIERTLEGPPGPNDERWRSWTFATLLKKNPEMIRYFDRSNWDE